MPKTKEAKKIILDDLNNALKNSKTVVISEYAGTKVLDIQSLRRQARESKIFIKVPKNTLFKKALDENKLKVEDEILGKPLILAFDENDEVTPAKVIYEKTKEVETLKILGAIVNGEFFGPEKVEALAKMPSREILLARIIGSLNAPITGIVNVLSGNLRGLINVINARKNKLEKGN